MGDYTEALRRAVRHFWATRMSQGESQSQQGSRGNVVGGKHCDGFVGLVAQIIRDAGIPDCHIYCARNRTLPGYFRPTKDWDLIVVADGHLLATVEVKSQIGSLGNNCNNRAEEVVGSGYDFRCAYREGAFQPSASPWLGYFVLVEDSVAARRAVKTAEPHFKVFPELKDASYATRYEQLCRRLVRERIYDAACLILSSPATGLDGEYCEPATEVGFLNFATSLAAKAGAFAQVRAQQKPGASA